MAQTSHHRQESNFTFHSKWPSIRKEEPQINSEIDPNPSDQELILLIGRVQQQLQDFNKQYENQHQNSGRKSFTPIKKQELEKVLKYFKKYEPVYFSKLQVKHMSLKFKKDVFIKKFKEGYYFGEVLEVKYEQKHTKKFKHGKGIFVYNLFNKQAGQKRIYEGEWNNDKKSGLGFEKFCDGSVYHGNYQNNKPHGKGKFTNSQGQVYQGQWKDGIKQGKGFWQGIHGETYMGQFYNGKPQGYGIFVAQNGNRYQGQYKNALKNGEGIQRFANGDLYKGLFQNGAPNGYGEYYWKNKSYFKGYFSNGLRTGQGLWKRSAGVSDKYEGQYQNDKKWGYGVFTWANGNLFKGSYEGDLRNGYGEMYWTDGSYYKGNWKDGLQDGKGQLFVVGEGLRIGYFEENRIVQIEYEQPFEDIQNEQNRAINTKISQKVLQRNLSKSSQFSLKAKQSKYTSLERRKPTSTQMGKINPLKSKTSLQSFVVDNKDKKCRISSQNEAKMKSVPLKKLIQNTENSRYLFKQKSQKTAEFRISQKLINNKRIDNIVSSSRASQVEISQKRKNRILHSSFYLHKFKKLKSQEGELSDQAKQFKNTINLTYVVKS